MSGMQVASETSPLSNGPIKTKNNLTNSINNIINNNNNGGSAKSPTPNEDNHDTGKPNHEQDAKQTKEIRRTSPFGLDLSKPVEEANGLDLSKSENGSPSAFPRNNSDSGSANYANGLDIVPPGSAHSSYSSSRSHTPSSAPPPPHTPGSAPVPPLNPVDATSPFRADTVPNGYSPDVLTNGGFPSIKFPEPYGKMQFDSTLTSSSSFVASCASSPTFTSKITDSYIAARLADNSFPKPIDTYSKMLEDYGNNARNVLGSNNHINSITNNNNPNNANNNNSNSGNNSNNTTHDNTSSNNNMNDSSKANTENKDYNRPGEGYKPLEALANGYKMDASPSISLKQENSQNSQSPGSFKSEAPPSTFPKPDSGMTNGTAGNKPEGVSSSSSQGTNQSLPSILNFSTNHLRGMAAESGLANYLNSYGVGGVPPPGNESRPSGGESRSGDGGVSRASPNNKLACRFCGKTFSQAGYIKVSPVSLGEFGFYILHTCHRFICLNL